MRAETISVRGRAIGRGRPCFIIAEAGVNHNGDLRLAHQLVDAAVAAGADAVKFQTFEAGRVVGPSSPKADYQLNSTDRVESQYDMLKRLELSRSDHKEVFAHCVSSGIEFLSTPFDESSADFLLDLGVSAYKVPSGEITNPSFLGHLAQKGLPIILSTGMSNIGEVDTAVRTIRQNGDCPLALLHCVSSYPAPASACNLRAMRTMEIAFGVPIGYSDHTLGNTVTLAAAALGACILEKHLTLDRGLPGPDHQASSEPGELADLVRSVREVESCLGSGIKEPAPCEANTAEVARRSLVAACEIASGEIIAQNALTARRPATGLPPAFLPFCLGRRAARTISSGEIITLDMLS